MKALFLFASLFFAVSAVSTFDNSNYMDEAAADFIDSHFVKDIQSAELTTNLTAYLANYMDKIDHISGHYSEVGNEHFYTVYGTLKGAKTFEMLAVDQTLFQNNQFYITETAAALGNCRRAPKGITNFPGTLCPYNCTMVDGPCFGIMCPPLECFWLGQPQR